MQKWVSHKLRQDIRFEKYLTENRFIKVHYLYGDSGTGKTRSIYEKHPPEEICRITNYPANGNVQFDAYKGQSVLVFEEFHYGTEWEYKVCDVADAQKVLDDLT